MAFERDHPKTSSGVLDRRETNATAPSRDYGSITRRRVSSTAAQWDSCLFKFEMAIEQEMKDEVFQPLALGSSHHEGRAKATNDDVDAVADQDDDDDDVDDHCLGAAEALMREELRKAEQEWFSSSQSTASTHQPQQSSSWLGDEARDNHEPQHKHASFKLVEVAGLNTSEGRTHAVEQDPSLRLVVVDHPFEAVGARETATTTTKPERKGALHDRSNANVSDSDCKPNGPQHAMRHGIDIVLSPVTAEAELDHQPDCQKHDTQRKAGLPSSISTTSIGLKQSSTIAASSLEGMADKSQEDLLCLERQAEATAPCLPAAPSADTTPSLEAWQAEAAENHSRRITDEQAAAASVSPVSAARLHVPGDNGLAPSGVGDHALFVGSTVARRPEAHRRFPDKPAVVVQDNVSPKLSRRRMGGDAPVNSDVLASLAVPDLGVLSKRMQEQGRGTTVVESIAAKGESTVRHINERASEILQKHRLVSGYAGKSNGDLRSRHRCLSPESPKSARITFRDGRPATPEWLKSQLARVEKRVHSSPTAKQCPTWSMRPRKPVGCCFPQTVDAKLIHQARLETALSSASGGWFSLGLLASMSLAARAQQKPVFCWSINTTLLPNWLQKTLPNAVCENRYQAGLGVPLIGSTNAIGEAMLLMRGLEYCLKDGGPYLEEIP